MKIGILLAALCVTSASILAQSPATSSFEVASIKPSNPNASSLIGSMPMAMPPSGGRFTAQNMTLRLLVTIAYELQDFQITGGPSWQTADKFDIVAKAENPNAMLADMRPLLKALLADRFKLKTHLETRELPIYALVVARSDGRLGENIKPSTADCGDAEAQQQKMADALAKGGAAAQEVLTAMMNSPCGSAPWLDAPGGFGMKFNGQPIATLTGLLTQATMRIVQDKTGLTGNYDYRLAMDPQFLIPMMQQLGVSMPANALPASDNPALLTAIQEQLGLKLEPRRGPVDVLVIDGAEKPSPD